MISIQLSHVTMQQIDHILALAKEVGSNDQLNNDVSNDNLDGAVENTIENYLLTCNDKKVELTKYLANLNKNEISEILALYYFFSKLTFDTTLTSNEELTSFWKVCNINADTDIARIGLTNMVDFLKERSNLATIFSNAVINLK